MTHVGTSGLSIKMGKGMSYPVMSVLLWAQSAWHLVFLGCSCKDGSSSFQLFPWQNWKTRSPTMASWHDRGRGDCFNSCFSLKKENVLRYGNSPNGISSNCAGLLFPSHVCKASCSILYVFQTAVQSRHYDK